MVWFGPFETHCFARSSTLTSRSHIAYYPLSAFLTLFANILKNPLDSYVLTDVHLLGIINSSLSPGLRASGSSVASLMIDIFEKMRSIASAYVEKMLSVSTARSKRSWKEYDSILPYNADIPAENEDEKAKDKGVNFAAQQQVNHRLANMPVMIHSPLSKCVVSPSRHIFLGKELFRSILGISGWPVLTCTQETTVCNTKSLSFTDSASTNDHSLSQSYGNDNDLIEQQEDDFTDFNIDGLTFRPEMLDWEGQEGAADQLDQCFANSMPWSFDLELANLWQFSRS